MRNETTQQQVERLVQANPHQSAGAIATKVGVSRQRVHQILAKSGYEVVVSVHWRQKAESG